MEQQQQEPVAIFIAQPPHRHPLVAISPEEHGYGVNIDGGKARRESVKFDKQGRYEAMDEELARILRKHSGNVANGGEIFSEIPPEAVRHARALDGDAPPTFPEGGITDGDREKLTVMTNMANKSLPPKQVGRAVELMNWATERFRVAHFHVPSAAKRPKIIGGRLAELVELLEEAGIKAE